MYFVGARSDKTFHERFSDSHMPKWSQIINKVKWGWRDEIWEFGGARVVRLGLFHHARPLAKFELHTILNSTYQLGKVPPGTGMSKYYAKARGSLQFFR